MSPDAQTSAPTAVPPDFLVTWLVGFVVHADDRAMSVGMPIPPIPAMITAL